MDTIQFIKKFQEAHPVVQAGSLANLISHHPMVVKISEIGGMLLGAASVCAAPFFFRTNKIGAVSLALMGALIFGISCIAYRALDILIAPRHSMESHAFTPGIFNAGRLYYQGHVPILELQSDDPYAAGLAHGYLLGGPLNELFGRLTLVRKLAEYTGLANLPQANQAPETLKAIREKLLPEHMRELEGIVEGFNQWSKENQWFRHDVTVDDLIMFHLMPDTLHFSPTLFELTQQNDGAEAPVEAKDEIPLLGCTVIIDEDQQEGLTFGRNMDWPSFGIFGRYSLVINRKYTDKKQSTAEIGLPGLVGTLTGMNQQGLSLAMIVCNGHTDSVRGPPAAFFNRTCLETCQSVQEVEDQIDTEAPLGSYHLNVADAHSAKSIHFYQGDDQQQHVTREWKAGKPLITTNCKYTLDGRMTQHMHCSREREQIITQMFDEAEVEIQSDLLQKSKLVEASLTLSNVNTSITTHTVVMYPQAMKMKAAFDNTFSASAQLQEIDLEPLFQ